jgi:hypothetical protein
MGIQAILRGRLMPGVIPLLVKGQLVHIKDKQVLASD